MVQTVLACGVVAFAALYVGWKFMPAATRRWLAARLGVSMRRRGLAHERVVWLEAKLNQGAACGGCDSRNACGVNERPPCSTTRL
jgi:hypothetical protein